MSGAFESTLLSPPRSTNKLFMETGFGVNAGFERSRNTEVAVSDGATANRAMGIYGPFDAVNNSREWVAGAASLTEFIQGTVPTSNPAVTTQLVSYQGNSAAETNNSLWVKLYTDGKISVEQWTTLGSTFRAFSYAGFRAAYSGQAGILKIYLVQGTTNPVVSWNGVDISANFSLTTATPPAWLDAAMVPTYRLVGYNWPSGPAPLVTPILGTTTAADDAFYMQTGKWPAWVVAGGSAKHIVTSSFVKNSGSGTISAATTSGFTFTGDGRVDGATVTPSIGNVIIGNKWRISFTINRNSGAAAIPFFAFDVAGLGFVSSFTPSLGLNELVLVSDRTYQNAANITVIFSGFAAGSDFTISGLIATPNGALSIPSVQPINVLDDVSTIGSNCGLILGGVTTATSNKKVWRIADLTKTSGNEQLLGGSVFVGTSQDFIKSWTIVNAGGTTTVSLGNASGGAQYVSGLSVPTGTTVVTLLTNTPLTTNLWCNANTTASLTHTIEGYRTV